MSLWYINIGYFLIGAFFLLSIKIIDNLDYFKKESMYSTNIATVFNYIIGFIFILVASYGFVEIAEVYRVSGSFDYLPILPMILLFTTGTTLMLDSLYKPTKNQLIALLIGTGITAIGYIIGGILTFIGLENIFGQYIRYTGYWLLIPSLITAIIAIVVAPIIYYKVLKPRKEAWNESMWNLERMYKIVNGKTFLIVLTILVFIEAMFQWTTSSLILLFIS
ncbi:MAG: hypothetical protein ACTSVE_08305 [Candidatus Helarchaeota archaeon]